jgi:hypothetical protein
MSCFKLPQGLYEHINSLICKFWWGSKQGERKTSWVSRDEMIKPKFMGRVGFRDIELFNLLLARQAWRIVMEPNCLSARVLKSRYFLSVNFLQFAFNYFDKDHDGGITYEEVKNKFYQSDKNKNSCKAQEQLQKAFNDIDINGDGKLSFEEFGKMMENIIKQD